MYSVKPSHISQKTLSAEITSYITVLLLSEEDFNEYLSSDTWVTLSYSLEPVFSHSPSLNLILSGYRPRDEYTVKSLKVLPITYFIKIGEFSLAIGKIDPSYCITKTKCLEKPTWDADDIQNMLTRNVISMNYYKKQ